MSDKTLIISASLCFSGLQVGKKNKKLKINSWVSGDHRQLLSLLCTHLLALCGLHNVYKLANLLGSKKIPDHTWLSKSFGFFFFFFSSCTTNICNLTAATKGTDISSHECLESNGTQVDAYSLEQQCHQVDKMVPW